MDDGSRFCQRAGRSLTLPCPRPSLTLFTVHSFSISRGANWGTFVVIVTGELLSSLPFGPVHDLLALLAVQLFSNYATFNGRVFLQKGQIYHQLIGPLWSHIAEQSILGSAYEEAKTIGHLAQLRHQFSYFK